MLKETIDRFSRWYNGLGGDRPVLYFFVFCLLFLVLLWVAIRYVKFEGKAYESRVPAHIGEPSGPLPTEQKDHKQH